VNSVTAPSREHEAVRPPAAASVVRAPSGPRGPSSPWWRRVELRRLAPAAVAAALALVYLIWQPRTVDLAAHEFRAELFGREGFTIWNGQWYGGHHTPAYSILSPPLAWLLSPRVVLALAAVSAAALFEPLAHRHWGPRALPGAIWFGAATGTLMFTARLPFALGVAFGVGSALSLQRRRRVLAPLLALLSTLSSPVAGLFMAMAAVAYWLGARQPDRDQKRTDALTIVVASFLPPLFLSWAFPEGGYAPFPFTAWVPIPIFGAIAAAMLWRRERTLAIGALLYAVGSTVALVHESPMGGNAVRLGALFGGPVLACVYLGRRWPLRPLAPLVVGFVLLGVWQWSPAVRDVRKYLEDPAARSNYFEPLRQFLATLPDQRRIEIPFTRSHWESAEIAPDTALARGWLRQLDTGQNAIFYKGPLTELTYASWLSENAVRYVALPSALPDVSSYRERALIERGLPYLHLRWRSKDWRVYEVTLPTPIVIPQGRANIGLEQFGSDRLLLRVVRPGQAIVRVGWTPYWYLENGCVERDGDWTRVTTRSKGFVQLSTRFAPERLFQRGRRCDDSG
jgi:hypothetical protein